MNVCHPLRIFAPIQFIACFRAWVHGWAGVRRLSQIVVGMEWEKTCVLCVTRDRRTKLHPKQAKENMVIVHISLYRLEKTKANERLLRTRDPVPYLCIGPSLARTRAYARLLHFFALYIEPHVICLYPSTYIRDLDKHTLGRWCAHMSSRGAKGWKSYPHTRYDTPSDILKSKEIFGKKRFRTSEHGSFCFHRTLLFFFFFINYPNFCHNIR